jgi:integrase
VASDIAADVAAVDAFLADNPKALAGPPPEFGVGPYHRQGGYEWRANWPIADSAGEVQQFEERHPIGTKARLALGFLLYTGQRRSDVIRFGKQHAKGGVLTFTQYKGRNRKPHKLTLPILPALQKIIDASPCGDMTFLINDLGRPFTDAGFGNKFRDWCDLADLPQCSAHGLRKAGATIAANNGATAHQLMAIFGWDTLKEAEKYTAKADQQRLAQAAMHLLDKR